MTKAWNVPKADCDLIRNCKRADVEITLAKLDPFIERARWLAKTNRYATKTIGRISLDTGRGGTGIHGKPMAQYVAASAILHCADGWSYLGRAISCLLRGDPHRVVHLAYYAELRAALSLLASEGLGIFSKTHFIIDQPEAARKLHTTPGTHIAAWGYLKYWSALRRSGDLFAEVVCPGGVSLSEWFRPVGGVDAAVRPRARHWFSQWSMDLALFSEDRDARNESSYRPDGIPTSWYVKANDALALAEDLWIACEPSALSLFEGIDRHILRVTAETNFTARSGQTPRTNPQLYSEYVDRLVDALALDPVFAPNWKQFLTRASAPQDSVLLSHSAKEPFDRPDGHAAVLSRSILLLRLATGSALKLIRSAGMTGEKLHFWWGELGLNRGLWDGIKDRGDLLDLWEDIEVLFEDIKRFRNQVAPGDQTFQLIGSRIPQVIAGLGGCERVAIWSLTP